MPFINVGILYESHCVQGKPENRLDKESQQTIPSFMC